MKHIKIITTIAVATILLFSAFFITRAPKKEADSTIFTISRTNQEQTAKRLSDGKYLRFSWALPLARIMTFRFGSIEPGGYRISQSMNARELIIVLTSEPQLKWITIPEGLRKEEIGERLAKELH